MQVIKPPTAVNHWDKTKNIYVFLAGSIEQGTAAEWQETFTHYMTRLDHPSKELVLLNPRRDEWDASWEQSINNSVFKEQVEWELSGLEIADWVIMYFDPNTKSPVTLLELGLIANLTPRKMLVCCPQGFYRKGNVDIVCQRYHVRQYDTLQAISDMLIKSVK
jgi:hypothetical protein